MGAWGFYDDENDTTQDFWISVQDAFLPKKVSEAMNDIYVIDGEMAHALTNKYMFDNPDKVAKTLQTEINKTKKMTHMTKAERESIVIGMALHYVRLLSDNNPSTPFAALRGIDRKIPDKLPKEFPANLAKIVASSVSYVLSKGDYSNWTNPKKRELALQHELYLFSNGKEGIKPTVDANKGK